MRDRGGEAHHLVVLDVFQELGGVGKDKEVCLIEEQSISFIGAYINVGGVFNLIAQSREAEVVFIIYHITI